MKIFVYPWKVQREYGWTEKVTNILQLKTVTLIPGHAELLLLIFRMRILLMSCVSIDEK